MAPKKQVKQEVKVEEPPPEVVQVEQPPEPQAPQIPTLSTGLQMKIQEQDIQELWISDNPKQKIYEICKKEKNQILGYEVEDFGEMNAELSVIAEFQLHNLVFAKGELQLDDYKTAVLLNILMKLIDIESIVKPQESKPLPYEQKLKSDFQKLQNLIITHSVQNPPDNMKIFTAVEVKKILEYLANTYFKHYRLYNHILTNKQYNETKQMKVFVDDPLMIPPLSKAQEVVKNPTLDEPKVLQNLQSQISFEGSVRESFKAEESVRPTP